MEDFVKKLDDILQQALELNGIDRDKAEEITESFFLLLLAEKLIEKAERKKGKTISSKEERRELRRILTAEMKTQAEMVTYKFLKKEELFDDKEKEDE